MIVSLPLRQTIPSYRYTIILDGVTHTLFFYFNSRYEGGKWFMQIGDNKGNLLLAGQPIISGWKIFERYHFEGLPKGTILPFDTTGKNIDPGQQELGGRVLLFYEEAEDA